MEILRIQNLKLVNNYCLFANIHTYVLLLNKNTYLYTFSCSMLLNINFYTVLFALSKLIDNNFGCGYGGFK